MVNRKLQAVQQGRWAIYDHTGRLLYCLSEDGGSEPPTHVMKEAVRRLAGWEWGRVVVEGWDCQWLPRS